MHYLIWLIGSFFMKNKFLSPSFLPLLSATVLFCFISVAEAKKETLPEITPTLKEGTIPFPVWGKQGTETINLYDDQFSFTKDFTGMEENFTKQDLVITVQVTPIIPSTFKAPQLIGKGPGCMWYIDNIQWSCTVLEGAECLSYVGYDEYVTNDSIPLHATTLTYRLLGPGTVIMQFNSNGDGNLDSPNGPTKYTMTFNITDNLDPSLK